METISTTELQKIEKHILRINEELDYLDPLDPNDSKLIDSKKNILQKYIDRLTPSKSKRPILTLIKNNCIH